MNAGVCGLAGPQNCSRGSVCPLFVFNACVLLQAETGYRRWPIMPRMSLRKIRPSAPAQLGQNLLAIQRVTIRIVIQIFQPSGLR